MKIKSFLRIAVIILALAGFFSCSGDSFEEYKKDRIVEDNTPTPDTTPPDIEFAVAITGTEVKVVFSEEIEPSSAGLIENYYVQGNNRVTVTSAAVQDDNRSVILTLSAYSIYRMQNGKEYTLLVQRVADVNNNKILNTFSTFIGKGQVIAEIYNGSELMPSDSPYPSYNSSYAEFAIGGTDIISYQYSLDESAWSSEQPIETKLAIDGLSEGFHSLRVIGKSATSGEWQDLNQPTIASFFIDLTSPVVQLSHIPPNVTDQVTIDVVVGGSDVATYRYRLNSGSWSEDTPVTTRITRNALSDGSYTLYVLGKDAAGNEQAAATECSWIVNTSSPVAVLTGAPEKFTRQRNLNISIDGNNVNFFKYRLNGGSWTEKSDTGSVISLNNLPDGTYTIEVIGSSDMSDDTDGPVIIYSWTVDNIAPVCSISNLTSNPTSSQSTHFRVGSDAGDVVGYIYRVNNEALSGTYSSDNMIEITSLPEGIYTIKVMGIDAAGNIQSESTAATWSWVVDLTPPHASLSGLPPVIAATKNIDIDVDGIGSYAYRYQLDNLPWSSELAVSLPIEFFNLADGYHTLYVVTRDEAGNWQTVQNATSYTWVVDTIPPVAVLTDTPSLYTNLQTAEISVGGTGVTRYKYRLDSAVWSIEYDRINYPSISLGSPAILVEGPHTLEVLAVDSAGNWQLTPTSYSWTIDTNVPTATLVNIPPAFTTSSSIDITVQSVDEYKYKIDGNAWSSVRSVGTHITESDLNEGAHTLLVMGRNSSSGLWQSEAAATRIEWSVDTNAPIVELGNKPASPTNSQNASFTVSGVGIYAYRYNIDNHGVFGTEVNVEYDGNTIELTNLSGASHTIEVIGRDQAGNWQSVPTSYTWVVNTSVPVAALSNLPAALTNQTILNVTVGGFDVVSYKYSYDGSDWSPELDISSPVSRVGVTTTTHTLRVIGKNSAGTWQSEFTPTEHVWTVNTTTPSASDITLSNLPNDPTAETGASITVGGTGITTYQYKLNNGSWSADMDISVPITLSSLIDNTYTLYVVAKNAAGNWLDRSQAKEFTWTVDTSSPVATITNRPDNPTGSKTASFDIGGAGIIEYKYRLYNGSWSSWSVWTDVSANINLSSLDDGSYTIEVCGRKAGGFTQADVNATTYTWVIDSVAPTVVLSDFPDDPTTKTSIAITVRGAGVAAYRFRLDDGEWLPSGSDKSVYFPLIISDLEVKRHKIEVIGRDEAGNWQATPYSFEWTINYPALVSPDVFDAGTSTTSITTPFGWITPGGTGSLKIQISADGIIDTNPASGTYGGFLNPLNGVNGQVISSVSPYPLSITSTEIQSYYAHVSVNARTDALAGDSGWTPWGKSSDGINIVGGVIGRVKNAVGLTALSGATVRILRMSDSYQIEQTTTDSNGDFAFNNVPIGTNFYKLSISADNFGSAGKNNVTSIIGKDYSVGNLYLVPNGSSAGTISGQTVDANDGDEISGATVEVYDYLGNLRASGTSDSSGNFTLGTMFSLSGTRTAGSAVITGLSSTDSIKAGFAITGTGIPADSTVISINSSSSVTISAAATAAGTSSLNFYPTGPGVYTVLMKKAGYYDLMVDNVVVNGNKNIERQAICAVLNEPQVRVIVLWGSLPDDLDLHLVGPTSRTIAAEKDGNINPTNRFHVGYVGTGYVTPTSYQYSYFESTGVYGARDQSGTLSTSSLVQDDYDGGYGPEAINIFRYGGYQYARGMYTYSVRNYPGTDWYATTVNTTVRVYDSQGLVQEIILPNGGTDPGNTTRDWKAFKINIQGNSREKRTITIINQFGNCGANSYKPGFDW